MKALFICGSPRKGNTEYLLNKLYDNYNNEKEIILLRKKTIRHCVGCLNCHKGIKCLIKDDMGEIIKKMKSSDVIVFGIPNYFDNVNSLSKAFIDRCHPLYKSEELKNKEIFFVFIGGGKIEGTDKYLSDSVYGFVKYLKLNNIGKVVFKALNPKDLEKVDIDFSDIIKKIEA